MLTYIWKYYIGKYTFFMVKTQKYPKVETFVFNN